MSPTAEELAIAYATKTAFRCINGGEMVPNGTVVDPDMRDAFIAGYEQAIKQAPRAEFPSDDLV